LFQIWYAQELFDGFFWRLDLDLLRIVVLVLDIDIAINVVVLVFVFKVIPRQSEMFDPTTSLTLPGRNQP
jgi:hypothetical protein